MDSHQPQDSEAPMDSCGPEDGFLFTDQLEEGVERKNLYFLKSIDSRAASTGILEKEENLKAKKTQNKKLHPLR